MPKADRGTLNYSLQGRGPPVVLVHGVGADLAGWDGVCERLVDEFTLVRLDLRGHGRSSPIREPYSLERFAADVIAVMDDTGVDQAHLVGFSLGGLIAQRLAIDWPDRFLKVALLSAVAGRTPEERARVTQRLALIRSAGINSVVGAARERWFTDEFVRAHPEAVERRIAELVANDVESYLEAYRVFGESELVDELHRIPHETLVLTGENDSGSNPRMARTMKDRIANAELVILPRLKHSLLIEAPDVLARQLRNFLQSTQA
jgi:(E)-2-((N-methylformamido)methylene)succinate hydrolase